MLNGILRRRKRPRADRISRPETVEIDDGSGTALVSGVLKGISETGALIHADGARALPNRIRLRIPALGIVTEAAIRWVKDDRFGVRFFTSVDPGSLSRRDGDGDEDRRRSA